MGLRYHVVSFTAFFLALGLGVLFGASTGVKSSIVEKQTAALSNLRQQFDRDIVPLREQNSRYSTFANSVPAAMLTGKLANYRIALVQTGDYADCVRKMRDALEQAGATVANTTIVERIFSAQSAAKKAEIQSKLQSLHPAAPSDQLVILHVLASSIAKGESTGDLDALEGAKLIRKDGDYSRSVDAVILVGGASEEFESRADAIDLPLINEIKSLGTKAIEVEPEAAGISYISALRSLEIVTIDNADTDIGRIAAVLAINAAPGDYGVKKTARSGMLPAPAVR